MPIRLDKYRSTFERGASKPTELLWIMVSAALVGAFWPGSSWRVALLRAFGARIGKGVVIKPFVQIKLPWRLVIGDHSWIGEGVWIDNLAEIRIGDHACVSQGAYLCTGSHDWGRETFDLINRPINIGPGAWVGAMARLAPGTKLGEGAVLTMGSVASGHLPPMTICRGNPAMPISQRIVQTTSDCPPSDAG